MTWKPRWALTLLVFASDRADHCEDEREMVSGSEDHGLNRDSAIEWPMVPSQLQRVRDCLRVYRKRLHETWVRFNKIRLRSEKRKNFLLESSKWHFWQPSDNWWLSHDSLLLLLFEPGFSTFLSHGTPRCILNNCHSPWCKKWRNIPILKCIVLIYINMVLVAPQHPRWEPLSESVRHSLFSSLLFLHLVFFMKKWKLK